MGEEIVRRICRTACLGGWGDSNPVILHGAFMTEYHVKMGKRLVKRPFQWRTHLIGKNRKHFK